MRIYKVEVEHDNGEGNLRLRDEDTRYFVNEENAKAYADKNTRTFGATKCYYKKATIYEIITED